MAHQNIKLLKFGCEIMRVAIIQPSFIPWKGFFDIINSVNTFVHLDDVQYTKSDWRNKNYIYGKNGMLRLTIPVKKSSHTTLIKDILIDNAKDWKNEHLKSIQRIYSKANYYSEYIGLIEDIYSFETIYLADFVINAIEKISKILGFNTNFVRASGLGISGVKDEKLIRICQKLGATHYLSGPSAKNYINQYAWTKAKIVIEFKDYNYNKYNQLSVEFNHQVSILDVIFNNGENTTSLIKSLPNE